MGQRESPDTETLLVAVYEAIHELARRRMAREWRGPHTLQPTALVNEVYLRLARDGSQSWSNPREFFAAAAEAMRRILIEHARGRLTDKRGGGRRPISLENELERFISDNGLRDDELIELHEALDALETESPDHALVVKLKYFVGMTASEIAESVGVSETTVNRRWTMARTWLRAHMKDGQAGPVA